MTPAQERTLARLVSSQWRNLRNIQRVYVDGASLNLANLTAVAKGQAVASLIENHKLIEKVDASVDVLHKRLSNGETVYGVNTGYGGSADVRCEPHQMYTMQQALLQLQHTGILPVPSSDGHVTFHSNTIASTLQERWVRAAMLIRANSVVRGHSAVRGTTIKTLLTLLDHDIIPLIPTRGSISASGDLQPLSYIAGLLEGNPGIYCWIGLEGNRRIVTASKALQSIELPPTHFGPKEALGLVNGTAISCAIGAMTLNAMNSLFALSQLLTAMNVEAVLGTATSFAPFISQVRPHPGQAEVASTILSALKGSKLASPVLSDHAGGHTLFQDRYSLRTVPQWLGPFAEDLLLANKQIEVEMNSTTDNPLIDPETGDIYHGGNFQAVSVTSAMEKTRLAAQAVGRMLFAQFTEMVNHATNRGLPPNLSADEPSTSFTLKGVDINMAAYMSELGFLANPVHSHVQIAEMGNQSLNSLALISARYTDQSVEILTMMCAATLYGVCQALDLRAMIHDFEVQFKRR
ncbi:L-Aspartase-like protein [Lophiotrema nucula]|uniref:L-Aspartase-like protein n=1 Tax=Lophiotrema nucula TaxID=690887 RepID=A0A6A5ZC28_9PLEO|nr:L-Aspartase-like protein [Lophiotrema nucula]